MSLDGVGRCVHLMEVEAARPLIFLPHKHSKAASSYLPNHAYSNISVVFVPLR